MDGILAHTFLEGNIPSSVAVSENVSSQIIHALSLFSPHIAEKTILNSISCSGIGLHTGKKITIKLHPAPPKHGILFKRTDLASTPIVKAKYNQVVDTRLSTVLSSPSMPELRIATIEHLMAALYGLGITNLLIEIDGPETPVLDGSASEFVFLLDCAGITTQETDASVLQILKPIKVMENDAYAELWPNTHLPGLSLSLTIDFPAKAIGQQTFSSHLTPDIFRSDMANCRTFVMRQEIEHLFACGLAQGGSLANAIVVDHDKIINPDGLRRPDEFVRHKMVDAIGDLALVSMPLQARFVGYKSGHSLNNKLLRKLFATPQAWRILNPIQSVA